MAIPPYAKLRGRMVERGISLEDISKALGISKQAMHKKLKGEYGFSQKDVIIICDLLDIDMSEIGLYFYEQIVPQVKQEV